MFFYSFVLSLTLVATIRAGTFILIYPKNVCPNFNGCFFFLTHNCNLTCFLQLAAEKYEEGEQALQEAKRVESEHQARLRTIHSQIERLRQLEQRALQVFNQVINIENKTDSLYEVMNLGLSIAGANKI